MPIPGPSEPEGGTRGPQILAGIENKPFSFKRYGLLSICPPTCGPGFETLMLIQGGRGGAGGFQIFVRTRSKIHRNRKGPTDFYRKIIKSFYFKRFGLLSSCPLDFLDLPTVLDPQTQCTAQCFVCENLVATFSQASIDERKKRVANLSNDTQPTLMLFFC